MTDSEQFAAERTDPADTSPAEGQSQPVPGKDQGKDQGVDTAYDAPPSEGSRESESDIPGADMDQGAQQ